MRQYVCLCTSRCILFECVNVYLSVKCHGKVFQHWGVARGRDGCALMFVSLPVSREAITRQQQEREAPYRA